MQQITLEQLEAMKSQLTEEQYEMAKKQIQSQGPITVPEKPQEQQCPYCLIAEGKIQANKVYEDSNFIAVLEIRPANPGHIVLFPKKHITFLENLNTTENQQLFFVINKLATTLRKLSKGVNILISEGQAAGQNFQHLLINIIPRFDHDQIDFKWQPKPFDEAKSQQLAAAIAESMKTTEVIEEKEEDHEELFKKLEKQLLNPDKRIS